MESWLASGPLPWKMSCSEGAGGGGRGGGHTPAHPCCAAHACVCACARALLLGYTTIPRRAAIAFIMQAAFRNRQRREGIDCKYLGTIYTWVDFVSLFF